MACAFVCIEAIWHLKERKPSHEPWLGAGIFWSVGVFGSNSASARFFGFSSIPLAPLWHMRLCCLEILFDIYSFVFLTRLGLCPHFGPAGTSTCVCICTAVDIWFLHHSKKNGHVNLCVLKEFSTGNNGNLVRNANKLVVDQLSTFIVLQICPMQNLVAYVFVFWIFKTANPNQI